MMFPAEERRGSAEVRRTTSAGLCATSAFLCGKCSREFTSCTSSAVLFCGLIRPVCMNLPLLRWLLLGLLLLPRLSRAQTVPAQSTTPPASAAPAAPPVGPDARPAPDSTRRSGWSLHFQQTVITQWHAPFAAPYSGAFSLQPREKAKTSLTSTLFVGRHLWHGATVYFNPELAGGSGLSAARGVAGFPNGDGQLHYAPEYVGEVYYSFNLTRQHATLSPASSW